MNLKDLNLKKSYDSDCDNILDDFYIPALSSSVDYKRLAGYFSSSCLAVAAKGIAGFIKNGGHMELITGAKFREQDIISIKEANENPDAIIAKLMLIDLENLEEEFIKDHVRALGWMVANRKIEIKIALVYDQDGYPLNEEKINKRGIFHQKVGILQDKEGNKLSFSGSDNETASAWINNIEEFKVFRSWEESEKEYLETDCRRFNKFWEETTKRTKVIDIPTAVKRKLIEIAPKNIEELYLDKWSGKRENIKEKTIKLWPHQEEAIEAWLKNNKKGILEMATGTGKTFAALGCLNKIIKDEKRIITIISCPYGHLEKQWLGDIEEFGINSDTIIADSSNYNWKNELVNKILDIKNGKNERLIVLTTHVTLSKDDFINIIRKSNSKLFLIVDEVHGVGAPKIKKGLLDDYFYRLGLSATPKRWFDLEGTEALFSYFGGTVYEFSLKKAINTINPATGKTFLVPYEYKPFFVDLTEEELYEYEKQTKKISKAYYHSKNKEEQESWLSLLLFKRQNLIKNAFNKYKTFETILSEMNEIKNCLVYCSPQQITKVQSIMNDYMKQTIIHHKFTEKESNRTEVKYGGISEREYLLRQLANGTYNVLVAMKCLDEGVDVPQIKTAIILSSTGNPREYIQRRGRVLRPFLGKEKAIIYDVIVVPAYKSIGTSERFELEKNILKKELLRYKEFALIAVNVLECLKTIEKIEERYNIVI